MPNKKFTPTQKIPEKKKHKGIGLRVEVTEERERERGLPEGETKSERPEALMPWQGGDGQGNVLLEEKGWDNIYIYIFENQIRC